MDFKPINSKKPPEERPSLFVNVYDWGYGSIFGSFEEAKVNGSIDVKGILEMKPYLLHERLEVPNKPDKVTSKTNGHTNRTP